MITPMQYTAIFGCKDDIMRMKNSASFIRVCFFLTNHRLKELVLKVATIRVLYKTKIIRKIMYIPVNLSYSKFEHTLPIQPMLKNRVM